MATAKSAANHVAAIVSDPANPPQTILVGGYPGKSPYEGYERLYLTPDLSYWIDVLQDDVLHTQPIPNDPLHGVYWWIRADAHILYPGQKPPEENGSDDGDGEGNGES